MWWLSVEQVSVRLLGRRTPCDCVSQGFIRSTLLTSLWCALERRSPCWVCGHKQVPFSGCVCQGAEGRDPAGLGLAACSACSEWCCSHPVLLRSSAWHVEQKREKWENECLSLLKYFYLFPENMLGWSRAVGGYYAVLAALLLSCPSSGNLSCAVLHRQQAQGLGTCLTDSEVLRGIFGVAEGDVSVPDSHR